jgi:DNA repair exonuclease SbcCD ATPase subunit
MTPIFLRDLALRSFRGIRSEMCLQLGGRLTVLVAPNGTGKTTVCNGVEWLLTGEVAGVPEGELRCLTASQASETSVTGHLELGQERETLHRLIGNWRGLGRSRGSISDTSVLGLLAPDAGRQERGQVANTIRRNGLLPVRWTDCLAYDAFISYSMGLRYPRVECRRFGL